MVNKFKIFLLAFFSLLFLLPLKTYAATFDVTIDNTWVSTMEQVLPDFKTTVETYISQNSQFSSKYFLYYKIRPLSYIAILFPANYDFASSPSINGASNNGIYVAYPYQMSSVYQCQYNATSHVITGCGNLTSVQPKNIYYQFVLMYSNFNILISNNTNEYNITYNDITTNYTYADDTYFPTLYNIVNGPINPPPVDPYPLLTSFFTIVFDSLVLTTDYFTSNYIFLTIFVIFLFYFIILLFRRLS